MPLEILGTRFNLTISDRDIGVIKNANDREHIDNACNKIWTKIVDWFCGTNRAEAKKLLFDLLSKKTDNQRKLDSFNILRQLASPAYQDKFIFELRDCDILFKIENDSFFKVNFKKIDENFFEKILAEKNICDQIKTEMNLYKINKIKGPEKIQSFYNDHIKDRVYQASEGLRKLLINKSVGSLLSLSDSEKIQGFVQKGDTIVIANAKNSKDGWAKHGYFLTIKSLDPMTGVIFQMGGGAEFGLPKENTEIIYGDIKNLGRKKTNEAYNVYISEGVYEINEKMMDQLNYFGKKGSLFKLNFNEEIVRESFKKATENIKSKSNGYLNYIYNCNHLVYDTIIQAQISNLNK